MVETKVVVSCSSPFLSKTTLIRKQPNSNLQQLSNQPTNNSNSNSNPYSLLGLPLFFFFNSKVKSNPTTKAKNQKRKLKWIKFLHHRKKSPIVSLELEPIWSGVIRKTYKLVYLN